MKKLHGLLVVATLLMAVLVMGGCDSAGAGGGNFAVWDYIAPSLVSESLVGGGETGTVGLSGLSNTNFDPDSFYPKNWYEYSEFIVVPEVAYNYNGRFGSDSWLMRDLAPILSDTEFSRYRWTESNVPGMYRMLDEGFRVFHMNETGSHYMVLIHNGPDSTEWLEVNETALYKRTIWLQEFAYDSIDMIEITEFDDYVFTRSIRFHGRFNSEGSVQDSFMVQAFGGIHRADDPKQQILGVMKRSEVVTTSTVWVVTEFEAQRAVAAFDVQQLMIRPPVEDLEETPFLFPFKQFSTRELAGPQNNGQWRAYDEPQEEGGDPVGPQAGEQFDASEFVTLDSVLAFLDSGLKPIHIVEVNILGATSDQIGSSGILDLPDWQRSDVNVVLGP